MLLIMWEEWVEALNFAKKYPPQADISMHSHKTGRGRFVATATD
jgi:hypothetical protein